jgi:TIR domain
MGVFICWSGMQSRSHQSAQILKEQIPEVIQTAEPFLWNVDVDAGAVWMNQLTDALKENRFGILCITPENKENSWIHFEAGALWKADEKRRVCPLLYDIRPAEITGPLSQLQAKQFNKSGFLELMKEVNERGCSSSIPESWLEKVLIANTLGRSRSRRPNFVIRCPIPLSSICCSKKFLAILRYLSRHPIRCTSSTYRRRARRAGWLGLVSGLLRLSQRHLRANLLCRNALSRLWGMPG